MDLSSKRSDDEDRIMQRQLYRPGQTQSAQSSALTPSKPAPAAAKAKPSSKSSSSELSSGYRRKVLIGLGVAAWLFFLGGVSYCLCLPDLVEMNHEIRAVFEDKNLTREQKFEKVREMDAKLTPSERKQMGEIRRKEMTRKQNSDMYKFLQMSRAEQEAQAKKEAEEWTKRMEGWRKMRAERDAQRAKAGGGGTGGGKGGGGGGGKGGGGPGGWGGGGRGGGGGGGDTPADFGRRLDTRSPEARAGGEYKGALMQKNGFGGPGGGRGR